MNIKEILSANGFSFKKAYGQNFITDSGLLKEIVAASGVGDGDTVLEIGAGAGTLTRELCAAVKRVFAYEIDRSLAPVLAVTLDGATNAELIFGDVMKKPMQELESMIGCEYSVVANLPYYITTPVIMRFVEQAEKVKSLVVMVQEEVAERLAAAPGTPEYGSITAAVALVGNAEIVLRVPKTKFFPMPKVDSAVVKIEMTANKFTLNDKAVFRNMLRAAFGNRRKMFVNNIMQTFGLTRAQAESLLKICGVSVTARGETLGADKFVQLANAFTEGVYAK